MVNVPKMAIVPSHPFYKLRFNVALQVLRRTSNQFHCALGFLNVLTMQRTNQSRPKSAGQHELNIFNTSRTLVAINAITIAWSELPFS